MGHRGKGRSGRKDDGADFNVVLSYAFFSAAGYFCFFASCFVHDML